MSTAIAPAVITAEQFAEMSFDEPCELVRGEIVEITRPDQSHGNACARVAFAMMQWAYANRCGQVITNDSGILTERDPDSLRGADVAFFAASQLPDSKLPRGPVSIVPVLAVEVLSPLNSWSQMRRKIAEYLAAGVHEVWIVDPDCRTVEAFRSDAAPVLFRTQMSLVSRELPEFTASVSELFAGVE
ncbi:MAG: Uma2 family endonuclease [Planctomycetota bacterium]|nr:MAG: Uma2 family endonuclease [Planctomycetota bacterium]